MADDVIKSTAGLKASDPGSGGTALYRYPMIGIVKNNVDSLYQGRIQVFLLDGSAKDPDVATNWQTVNFLSPFFGSTPGSAPQDGYGEYITVPSAYGMWYSPPDIGTSVLCMFVDGDPSKGYWVGCIPTTSTLSMVPAIPGTDYVIPNQGESESYGGAIRLPTASLNANNPDVLQDFNNTLDAPKPVHSYVAAMMMQQGVIRDPIRGPISSSAQRESPSRVGWGVSTPGRPIYEGGYDDQNLINNLEEKNKQGLKVISRRGGHSIVMDDGDFLGRDQLIRIRTALGHQIMMSDDGEVLSIMHRNGQSYIELGKEGTVDMYATNSINMRSQGDINIHADRDVLINGKKNLHMAAETMSQTTAKNFEQLTGGKHTISVGTIYNMTSTGAFIINGGLAGTINAALALALKGKFLFLNPVATPAIPANVKGPPINVHDDTLFDINKAFVAAPGKTPSICTRIPAHYPWSASNQGVDIKVELSQEANFPPDPPAAVQAVNQAASGTGGNVAVPSTTAAVPGQGTSAIGGSLGPEETNGLLGQLATNVRNGPGGQAIATKGFAVVSNNGTKTLLVGQYGQTPEQLEAAGVIKAGSAQTINSLIQQGKDPSLAFSNNMFTGVGGVNNFDQLIKTPTVQTTSAVNSLTTSYSSLRQTGVFKGNETPEQIAGLTIAGATNSVSAVTAATTNASRGANVTTAQSNQVLRDINTGNEVVKVVNNQLGPFNGLTTAVNAYNSTKQQTGSDARGVRAAAFNSALDALGPFEARQPLRLSVEAARRGINPLSVYEISKIGLKDTIASEIQLALRRGINAAVVTGRGGGTGQEIYSTAIAAASNSAFTSITQIKNAVIGAAIGVQEGLSFLARGQFGSAASTIAAGLGGLPGGIGVAARLVDTGIQAARILPSQISNIFTTTRTAYETFRTTIEAAKLNNFINNIQITTKLGEVTTGTVNGIQGVITGFGAPTITASVNQLGQLKDNVNSFSGAFDSFKATVSTAVSAAATSAIQIYNAVAAVASLFGGKRKVRLATKASNTVQRSGINQRVLRNFGNPKIPPPIGDGMIEANAKLVAARKELIKSQQPNYSGTGPTGTQLGNNPGQYTAPATTAGVSGIVSTGPESPEFNLITDDLIEQSARTGELTNKIQQVSEQYRFALNNYPKGDPRTPRLKAELDDLTNQIRNGGSSASVTGSSLLTKEQILQQLTGNERVYYNRFGKLPDKAIQRLGLNPQNPFSGVNAVSLLPGATGP